MTNPFRFSIKHGGLLVIGLASVVAVAVLAYRVATRSSSAKAPAVTSAKASAVTVLAAATLAMIVSTSLFPVTAQLLGIAQAPGKGDEKMTKLGRELNSVTEPGARIAVLYAGSPAYYADRAMIDLLGKSDRRIAMGPPSTERALEWNATFYPGHNKWDFGYSIGELKPDVVADFWGGEKVVQRLGAWGYTKRCLADGTSVYVRSDSSQIHWAELSSCRTAQ
jgi:hypothetical protein